MKTCSTEFPSSLECVRERIYSCFACRWPLGLLLSLENMVGLGAGVGGWALPAFLTSPALVSNYC